ncbi:MAG: hypothetical protein KGL39_23365 [Patescibacteria group bacterium]|nr:hypothetical protein [Patescibacteria group bacterium]
MRKSRSQERDFFIQKNRPSRCHPSPGALFDFCQAKHKNIDAMNLLKVTKDQVARLLLGKAVVPAELLELSTYFRRFKEINFEQHKEDGLIVAVSTDFKYGTIIAHGRNQEELDNDTRDAILTAFGVPSAYQKEADLRRVSERKDAYALA